MNTYDWAAIELVARTPEGRANVEHALQNTREAIEKGNEALAATQQALANSKSEENIKALTRDLESQSAKLTHLQAQADRLEKILRDTAL